MRLYQLHEYAAALLAAGVDRNAIICLTDRGSDARLELFEVNDARVVTGPYREDPLSKDPWIPLSHRQSRAPSE
jgi:hypothetical protein